MSRPTPGPTWILGSFDQSLQISIGALPGQPEIDTRFYAYIGLTASSDSYLGRGSWPSPILQAHGGTVLNPMGSLRGVARWEARLERSAFGFPKLPPRTIGCTVPGATDAAHSETLPAISRTP